MYLTLLGHKDHGKSTFAGRLLYDTKSVPEDRIREAEAISTRLGRPMEFAFLLDSFEEERAGGMTIDVIHARVVWQGKVYHLVDVPGHRELIKNMLTGASTADGGILIVSAQEGVEPQTGQHLRLARWLGLWPLAVAVNKMDCLEYRRNRFDAIRAEVDRLRAAAGYEQAACYIPISAYEGDNLVCRSERMPWYTGPCVMEWMAGLGQKATAAAERPFRMPVQDVYRQGDRPVLTGRIESGTIRIGARLVLLPSRHQTTVTAIESARGPVNSARAGENIGLVLADAGADVARGALCADPAALPHVAHELSADVIFLEEPSGRLSAECGLAVSPVQIEVQDTLVVGEVCRVRLFLQKPLVVEAGRGILGRLAIRREGRVIGVARVQSEQ